MASLSRKIGIKGKVIHSQGREIIANIIKFMKQEAEHDAPIIPLANFKQRVIAATKISVSSYRRILKESADIDSGAVASFSTPHKMRPRKSPKASLHSGEIETIRTIVHEFYIMEKRRPTLKGESQQKYIYTYFKFFLWPRYSR